MKLKITIMGGRRNAVLALSATLAAAAPGSLRAQSFPVSGARATLDSVSPRVARRHFYEKMAGGVLTSILLHESAHFAASYAMGFHPRLGIYKGRPTVFSGISEFEHKDRHKQFIFSAAGMTVQEALDEIILEVPHRRGGPFERGILAGGIGTTLFYVTAGRNARVSDISVMARTSSLSKTELSLIFGSVAALHAFRIGRDGRFAHFFAVPSERTGFKAGISLTDS